MTRHRSSSANVVAAFLVDHTLKPDHVDTAVRHTLNYVRALEIRVDRLQRLNDAAASDPGWGARSWRYE